MGDKGLPNTFLVNETWGFEGVDIFSPNCREVESGRTQLNEEATNKGDPGKLPWPTRSGMMGNYYCYYH